MRTLSYELRRLAAWLHYRQHRTKHWLQLQPGYVVSGWAGGALWIGYRCVECGEVTGAHIAESSRRDGYSGPPPTKWDR